MSTFLDRWNATTQQVTGAGGQAQFALDRLADVLRTIDPERTSYGADYADEIDEMTARIQEITKRLTS